MRNAGLGAPWAVKVVLTAAIPSLAWQGSPVLAVAGTNYAGDGCATMAVEHIRLALEASQTCKEGDRGMRDIFEGGFKELKGKIEQQWGRLTDDEIAQAHGSTDELAGIIQRKYGGNKEDIKRQLEEMQKQGRGPSTRNY